MLRTDEYIQMAGRAGRRGKDKIGYVFYLPDREPPPLEDIKKMMKGGKPRVQSRMDFGYDFLLKTLHTKNLKWIGLVEKSYWFQQHKALQQSLEDEKADYQKKLVALEQLLTADMRADLEEKQTLQATINATQNAKKKDAQRKLEQWKNTHMGAKWANAEQQFTQWNGLIAEIKSLDDAIHSNSKYTNAIEKRLDFLQDIGFLAEDRETLTTEGTLATEFNEGHPVLCTMLAFRKTLSELSADEIATCLAAFVNDSDKEDGPGLHKLNVPESVRDCLYKIGDIAAEAGQKEYKYFGPTNFWDLSTVWIEPIWRHLQGEHLSQIAAEYEIFEGNLVRTLLRIANLVEEWTSAATYLEDIDMLNKLDGLKERLITGIVVPDSLYLHL
jgi:superfamily II RNA helicase